MIRLPSVRNLRDGFVRVIRRFPATMALCAATVVTWIVGSRADVPDTYLAIGMALSLGIPLSLAAAVFAESRGFARARGWVLAAGVVLVTGGYAAWLTGRVVDLPEPGWMFVRHAFWVAAALVAVLLAAAARRGAGESARFWEFSRGMVWSFVRAWLWTMALSIGISAAYGAVSVLFDIEITEFWFTDTYSVLWGVLAPALFLSRVPSGHPAVRDLSTMTFSKEMRAFAQYILVPLTLGYFVILYAYAARITLLREWPEGILAQIILGASSVALLTYVALYPIRESVPWARRVGTALLGAMLPLSGLLYWTVAIRISQYGVTENRYLVVVLAAWLCATCVYLLAAKSKDLRVPAAMLGALALVISTGPWGAFAVSERNQTSRLETMLVDAGAFEGGKIVAPDPSISRVDRLEIMEIVSYLNRTHDAESIESWLPEQTGRTRSPVERVLAAMGEPATAMKDPSELTDEDESFDVGFSEAVLRATSANGYAYVSRLDLESTAQPMLIAGIRYEWSVNKDDVSIELRRDAELVASFPMEAFLERGLAGERSGTRNRVSREEATVTYATDAIDAQFVFRRITGMRDENGIRVTGVDADVLFTLK